MTQRSEIRVLNSRLCSDLMRLPNVFPLRYQCTDPDWQCCEVPGYGALHHARRDWPKRHLRSSDRGRLCSSLLHSLFLQGQKEIKENEIWRLHEDALTASWRP